MGLPWPRPSQLPRPNRRPTFDECYEDALYAFVEGSQGYIEPLPPLKRSRSWKPGHSVVPKNGEEQAVPPEPASEEPEEAEPPKKRAYTRPHSEVVLWVQEYAAMLVKQGWTHQRIVDRLKYLYPMRVLADGSLCARWGGGRRRRKQEEA